MGDNSKYISLLKEYCEGKQHAKQLNHTYKLLEASGPSHIPVFGMAVCMYQDHPTSHNTTTHTTIPLTQQYH